MNQQEDWFNADFAEKLQEDKELTILFTEKALVVFGSSSNGVRKKDLLCYRLLCFYVFFLVTLFGVEIRNVKKMVSILKLQLKRSFQIWKELDWETINDVEKSAVIRKDVRLVEGLNLTEILNPLENWRCSPSGWEIQAHCKTSYHLHQHHRHRLRGLKVWNKLVYTTMVSFNDAISIVHQPKRNEGLLLVWKRKIFGLYYCVILRIIF
jgi:hypothetical protein